MLNESIKETSHINDKRYRKIRKKYLYTSLIDDLQGLSVQKESIHYCTF